MKTAELIYQEAQTLPEFMQAEVLDFIGYLNSCRPHAPAHSDSTEKQAQLEAFFASYKTHFPEFQFDREEANAR